MEAIHQKNTFEQNLEITKEEQEAWRNLGKELIFNTENETSLSPENTLAISEEIQNQFVSLQESRRKKLFDKISESIQIVRKDLGLNPKAESLDPSMVNKSLLSKPPLEFIKELCNVLAIETDAEGYFGWGFTPKLASLEEGEVHANCLGRAILLGTYCKQRGIHVEIGITPDHPILIATIDGKKYKFDLSEEPEELTEGLQEKENYSVYINPKKETGTSEKFQREMVMIFDFDQAVLHEVLENVAVLSHVSVNEDVYMLPGSRDEGKKIASEHKEALQMTDWQLLQRKLFPKIVGAFEDNKEEWLKEISRLKEIRGNQYLAGTINEAIYQAVLKVTPENEDSGAHIKRIMDEGKKYKKEITDFLFREKDFEGHVPQDIQSFFKVFKEKIDSKEDEETRKVIYQKIELTLLNELTA